MNIFISYNKNDKNIATEVALFLAAESLNVWFDEWQISAGDSIVEEIQEGFKSASHFIILWSKNASASAWVRKELSSALKKAIEMKDIKVIPVILDNTPLPSLLNDVKHIYYQGGKEEDRKNIIQSVTGHSPSRNFIRSIVKKYHEVIHYTDDPIGFAACPRCGSSKLKSGMYTDYERDENYFIIECSECSFIDWTQ